MKSVVYYFTGTGNNLQVAKPKVFNLPRRVTQFINEMSIEKSKNAFFFAVIGCGNISGVALTVPAKILAKKGVTLNFAEEIIMVGNYVAMYKMNERNPEKYQTATDQIPALVRKIVSKTQQPAPSQL